MIEKEMLLCGYKDSLQKETNLVLKVSSKLRTENLGGTSSMELRCLLALPPPRYGECALWILDVYSFLVAWDSN